MEASASASLRLSTLGYQRLNAVTTDVAAACDHTAALLFIVCLAIIVVLLARPRAA
jgi:hypothetical protein